MTKRTGNQEPTNAVILPYKITDGEKAISLYEKSNRKAQEWQKRLINHILSKNEEDLWVHTRFGYSVPRRNGKNEVVAIRELYALLNGEQVLHTAHRTNTSHSAWERLVRIVEDIGYIKDEDYTTLKAKGNESIFFFESRGRVSFRTRTTTGGLGEGFDLLVIDEAQEYEITQETTLKYTVSASKKPQTLMLGTPPTPISKGTVFTSFREEILKGGVEDSGWADWSVEEQSDTTDKELWYLTNPSLGTILTERAIKTEVGTDDLDFNIQRLGLWIKYNQKSVISEKEWDRLEVKDLPKLEGGIFAGIKYGRDGVNVALSIAIKTSEDKIFIETIDCRTVRQGNKWIIDFLRGLDICSIAIDGVGKSELLETELKKNKIHSSIIPSTREFILANSLFERGIHQGDIQHKGQPSLKAIATNCDKRFIGTNGGFGYRSLYEENDISILDSVILAYWQAKEFKEPKKQRVRY